MQDQNADTEWNDALRKHGIIPEKKEVEITEDDIVKLLDKTVQQKTQGKQLVDMTLDELAEREDEEDERFMEQLRQQRMRELKEQQAAANFGDIREISADEYVEQVNKAGDDIWVILYLYKPGIPLCTLINQHLVQLSKKFPATKFLKSVSTNCIANYPDKNVPTIFVYFEGNLKSQFIGPHTFAGMNLKQETLEWMLAESGAVRTTLEEDPRKKHQSRNDGFSILTRDRRTIKDSDSESDDD